MSRQNPPQTLPAFHRTLAVFSVVALLVTAFLWGRMTAGDAHLLAQNPTTTGGGRQPLQPPRSGGGGGSLLGGAGTTTPPPATVVLPEGGGQAAVSANGFLAVTGSYGVGTSVLYLIDTVDRQMAVYEATGGTAGQRAITLVGARRIDLDLELEEYNDDSEYTYTNLKELFERRNRRASGDAAPKTPGTGN